MVVVHYKIKLVTCYLKSNIDTVTRYNPLHFYPTLLTIMHSFESFEYFEKYTKNNSNISNILINIIYCCTKKFKK